MQLFPCISFLCIFNALVILTILYLAEWRGVVNLDSCAVLCTFWFILFCRARNGAHFGAILVRKVVMIENYFCRVLLKIAKNDRFLILHRLAGAEVSTRKVFFPCARHLTREFQQRQGCVKIGISTCHLRSAVLICLF